MKVVVHEFVTGGGLARLPSLPESWAAEGRAMRRALAEDLAAVPGVAMTMTLDARFPDEPGPWTVVRVGPGREPRILRTLAAGADYTAVIAPEGRHRLLRRVRLVGRVGRSLGSRPEAVALAGDKFQLGESLRALGLPFPEGMRVEPGRGLPGTFPYPAVLKPIDGAGAVETFVLETAGDVPDGCRDAGAMLLQPLHRGTPMSASFLVGADGRAVLVGVGKQRVAIDEGRITYLGGTVPAGRPEWAELARRAVAAVPGLRGWVGVDFLRDELTGRTVLLEINPRLTTSFVGLRRLLPAGTLARGWLAAVSGRMVAEFETLAERVHAHRPVTFHADGRLAAAEDP